MARRSAGRPSRYSRAVLALLCTMETPSCSLLRRGDLQVRGAGEAQEQAAVAAAGLHAYEHQVPAFLQLDFDLVLVELRRACRLVDAGAVDVHLQVTAAYQQVDFLRPRRKDMSQYRAAGLVALEE